LTHESDVKCFVTRSFVNLIAYTHYNRIMDVRARGNSRLRRPKMRRQV
jgi:hypothetical protein